MELAAHDQFWQAKLRAGDSENKSHLSLRPRWLDESHWQEGTPSGGLTTKKYQIFLFNGFHQMDLIFLKFSSKQRRNNAYSWGWRASKISCYHQRCSLDRDRMQTTPQCVAFSEKPEVDDIICCGLSRGIES